MLLHGNCGGIVKLLFRIKFLPIVILKAEMVKNRKVPFIFSRMNKHVPLLDTTDSSHKERFHEDYFLLLCLAVYDIHW